MEQTPPQTNYNGPNIFQRILAVMKELDYIQKGPTKVNGFYSYVSHDQVSAKVHPLLVKYGIAVIPSVDELKQEGNRTEAKVSVHFVNVDNPSEVVVTKYYGYGVDSGDKGPGKAISYACKYALLKTFCLETGDDPDFDAEAAYEPVKCLEFDYWINTHEMTAPERKKLSLFLAHSALILKLHVEDVKRAAMTRPEEFLKKFKEWKPSKGE